MRYVMVSYWPDHWDELSNRETHYITSLLKGGMSKYKIKDNTQTTFIKLERGTKKILGVWEGTVYGIRGGGHNIFFKVLISKVISSTKDLAKYNDHGWYVENGGGSITSSSIYEPPFFSILANTSDWKEFEDFTYYLLKLIGIHKLYKFDHQKGRADGFFKIGNLAVLYDSTLNEDYLKLTGPYSKTTQIDNFCAQLEQSTIKIEKQEIRIADCVKQVWIITRKTPSDILKNIENIQVKVVPIESLIDIYHKRLLRYTGDVELEQELKSI